MPKKLILGWQICCPSTPTVAPRLVSSFLSSIYSDTTFSVRPIMSTLFKIVIVQLKCTPHLFYTTFPPPVAYIIFCHTVYNWYFVLFILLTRRYVLRQLRYLMVVLDGFASLLYLSHNEFSINICWINEHPRTTVVLGLFLFGFLGPIPELLN